MVLESGEEHGGGGGKKKTKISAATDSSPKYTKTQKFEKRKTKNHVEN